MGREQDDETQNETEQASSDGGEGGGDDRQSTDDNQGGDRQSTDDNQGGDRQSTDDDQGGGGNTDDGEPSDRQTDARKTKFSQEAYDFYNKCNEASKKLDEISKASNAAFDVIIAAETAKKIGNTLSTLLAFVPGIGPALSAVINALMGVTSMTEDAAKIVVAASFELSVVSIRIFEIGCAAFNANEVTDAMRGKLEDAMQNAGNISRKIADAARS